MPHPISVVIPSRGDAPHLRSAIRSAASAGAAEIVVALPSPTSALDGFEARVVEVGCTEDSPSARRNAALERASHARVAFLDDDDLWEPFHLEEIERLFSSHPDAPWVATRARAFLDSTSDGSGSPPAGDAASEPWPDVEVPSRVGLGDLLRANPFATPAVAVDRDRLPPGAVRFDPARPVMEDYDLWLRLAESGDAARGTRASVWVRRRSGSASADPRAMARESLTVLGRYADRAGALGLSAAEWSRRVGRLWIELAWGELAEGRGPDVRRALLGARHAGHRDARQARYWWASWLPRPLRRRAAGSRSSASRILASTGPMRDAE